MKAGWHWANFEQVVQSRGAGSSGLPQSEWENEGRFPVIGQGSGEVEGWTGRHDLVVTPQPSLVLFGGHTRRAKHVSTPFVPGPNVKILQPKPELDSRFLYYFLVHLPIESKGYADHFPLVRKCRIPLPPLPEQWRIVDLLDRAFDGLAVAAANAEKNLENARELFESHLSDVFTQRGEGWVERRIEEIAQNLDSKRVPITKGQRKAGPYPYYGASGVVDHVADYIFDGDLLLVSEDGANLLARSTPIAFSVSGRYWVNNHAHVLRFDDLDTQRYVEYYFASISIAEYVRGAAQPKLTQKALNAIPVHIPSAVQERKAIVAALDSVSAATDRFAQIYEQKQAALAELKKSLLHQAFSGAL